VKKTSSNIIYGINPILEALKSRQRRILKIFISNRRKNKEIDKIIQLAKAHGIKFKSVDLKTFQQICPGDKHQGIAGIVSNKELVSVEEMIEAAFEKEPNPVLVVLDHLEDPRNLGSITRSAEVLGIRGVIIPKNRAADLTPAVSKSSAGAVEYMLISRVSNTLNTILILKKKGFWIIGAKQDSKKSCFSSDFKKPIALVLGGEGKGFRPLIEKNCDEVISIPQSGHINSLNVSCAAAILFYEILKQKTNSP
jgi:23S rRNA (guanosine2251-2'-O)-methyltransferase